MATLSNPGFIPPGDQIVSKAYMTLVEDDSTRLRHYLHGDIAKCCATPTRLKCSRILSDC